MEKQEKNIVIFMGILTGIASLTLITLTFIHGFFNDNKSTPMVTISEWGGKTEVYIDIFAISIFWIILFSASYFAFQEVKNYEKEA